MIAVTINGKQQTLTRPTTVAAYVQALSTNERHLAIARNGDVIPRDRWPDTLIEDGDSLEIVRMVGGGAGTAPRVKEPLAMDVLFLVLAVVAGIAAAAQAFLNGSLGQERGVPEAIFVSGAITYFTLMVILVILVVFGERLNLEIPGRPLLYLLPLLLAGILALAVVRGLEWYYFGGGLCGVAILFIMAGAVPRIGVGPASAALVAGMMGAALFIDHFGVLNLAPSPIAGPKVIGALFLVAGVILVRGV